MSDETTRVCTECKGTMSSIIVMDKMHPIPTKHSCTGSLEYRLPEDRLSFWTGKYPTAGTVNAFMCERCGRIALYAGKPGA